MRIKNIEIRVAEYDSLAELTDDERELVIAARDAAPKAYAPYSGFKVGSALRMDNGMIITGNNQENSSYPEGTCAERSALFWANANYPDMPVRDIAITAIDTKGNRAEHISPCGGCRQVILETQSRFKNSVRIILDSCDKLEIIEGAENMLPLSFELMCDAGTDI